MDSYSDLTTTTTEVLIVGAGPTGLTMACELLRHGIQCRIIDKAASPSVRSKALVVQVRTLEIFQQMDQDLEQTRLRSLFLQLTLIRF